MTRARHESAMGIVMNGKCYKDTGGVFTGAAVVLILQDFSHQLEMRALLPGEMSYERTYDQENTHEFSNSLPPHYTGCKYRHNPYPLAFR
jgi:hypothetical protein